MHAAYYVRPGMIGSDGRRNMCYLDGARGRTDACSNRSLVLCACDIENMSRLCMANFDGIIWFLKDFRCAVCMLHINRVVHEPGGYGWRQKWTCGRVRHGSTHKMRFFFASTFLPHPCAVACQDH